MGRATAHVSVPGRAAEVEALYYDPQRWASWIDGFAHVSKLEGEWPSTGSRLTWISTPNGRGRVFERVTRYEARVGQTVEVEDERLRGTQTVTFEPEPGSVTVGLDLRYELKERNLLTPLTDLLFIRRALRDSLKRSLIRLAREHRAELELS